MSSIPEDIIIDILSKLPVKSIFRFRCVCKSWYNLIKNPNFVKLQLKYSMDYGDHGIVYDGCSRKICYVDYDSSSSTLSNNVARIDYPLEHQCQRILGSCNGLVCYRSYQNDIIVWNPYLKDYKEIPPRTTTDMETRDFIFLRIFYVFCYDLKTQDYWFTRMAYSPGRFTEIIIYSLRSNSWNIVNKSHKTYLCSDGGLACFQGILHWLEKPWGYGHDSVIGSFDIGNKAFKEIPLPQYFSNKFDRICVRLLGGCLSVIGSEYQTGCEIWMMQNYGVHQSWTKMFIIHETGDLGGFRYLVLRNSFKNRMILVQVDDDKSYMYDLKHEKFIKLEINLSGCCTLDFFGSLVSPNNLLP